MKQQEAEDSCTCICGHEEEEHGGGQEDPENTACNVEGCGCTVFEAEAAQ